MPVISGINDRSEPMKMVPFHIEDEWDDDPPELTDELITEFVSDFVTMEIQETQIYTAVYEGNGVLGHHGDLEESSVEYETFYCSECLDYFNGDIEEHILSEHEEWLRDAAN